MPRLLLILLIVFFYVSGLSAQKLNPKKVPSVVLNQFKKVYHKATDVDWEKINKLYKVEFDFAGREDIEVWYDESLRVVRKVETLFKNELPTKLKDVLNVKFKNYKIDDLKRVFSANRVNYLVHLETNDEELVVTMDENGDILSMVRID
ncbi:MAG: hypothetical protein J5I59_05145 [Saprospiraceae bacterium]|nr:hypothetical protein [Saprospiraceae bacterium]